MEDLYTSKGLERIARLQKRYEFLVERINQSDVDLTYDKAEASAIGWAIEVLTLLRRAE